MRLFAALVPVASALLPCACSSTAATVTDAARGVDVTFPDVLQVNSCLVNGPAGAACMGDGVCGEGQVNDSTFLCLSSIEICCVPASALHIDAGLEPLPDGNFVVPHDAGRDATSSGDAGHDAGQPGGDAAHDARQDEHDAHQDEHDAGHDAGEGTKHDAAGDATTTKPADAGHDARHG